MSQDEQARSADTAEEPLSPELALVDPDAARRARERLELFDGSTNAAARHVEGAVGLSVRDRLVAAGGDPDLFLPSSPPQEAEEGPDARPEVAMPARSRRRTFWAIAMTLLAAMGGIAAAFALVPFRSRSETAEAGSTRPAATRPAATPPAATRPAATTPATRERVVPQPKKTTARPRARSRRAPLPPPAPQSRVRKPPEPVLERTRTFVWPSVPRATRYRVEFFRRGRKIFEASPVKPRLELPQRWQYKGRRFQLTRGTYRWQVRPAFGRSSSRLGEPITSSTWIVR